MTIKFSDITGGGIPYGNTAGRPANPGIGKLYSNGETARLELYTNTGWQNIVQETPGVVSFTGTVLESNSTNTIVISGTNFASGAVVSLIGNDGTEYIASSTTVNSIVQITATFGVLSASKEPYDIKVVNPSNLYGVLADAVTVNDTPVWITAGGSLGSFIEQSAISISVAATDEENNTITYSLASGSSLPVGITLNSSTGVISGTLPDISTDTIYSFTINASDGNNTSQSRTFSITSKVLSVEYLVVAGGGGGAGDYGGGGGAGGLKYGNIGLVASTAYTITVGQGGNGSTGATVKGNNGQSSVFASISTTGGGGGGAEGNSSGLSGGSGGGTSYTATQTAGSGVSGEGNSGGNASTTGYGAPNYPAAGGGGAGSAGNAPSISTTGGTGGSGLQYSITGTSLFYAAGGGGGSETVGTGGAGGSGIGGSGATSGNTGSNGAVNTGSGGGGGRGDAGVGGSGGSGVVIIAYLNTLPAISNISAGLTYDQPTRAGYRVYRFTAGTGTITF